MKKRLQIPQKSIRSLRNVAPDLYTAVYDQFMVSRHRDGWHVEQYYPHDVDQDPMPTDREPDLVATLREAIDVINEWIDRPTQDLLLLEKKQTQRSQRDQTERAAEALAARIRAAGPKVLRTILATYDDSQGDVGPEDLEEGASEEDVSWAQHDHAIEVVCNYLADQGLLVDGDTEAEVSEAFHLISS